MMWEQITTEDGFSDLASPIFYRSLQYTLYMYMSLTVISVIVVKWK